MPTTQFYSMYSHKDVSDIERKLNQDLSSIDAWLSDNSLFLNREKTECLLFGTLGKLSAVNSFKISLLRVMQSCECCFHVTFFGL